MHSLEQIRLRTDSRLNSWANYKRASLQNDKTLAPQRDLQPAPSSAPAASHRSNSTISAQVLLGISSSHLTVFVEFSHAIVKSRFAKTCRENSNCLSTGKLI